MRDPNAHIGDVRRLDFKSGEELFAARIVKKSVGAPDQKFVFAVNVKFRLVGFTSIAFDAKFRTARLKNRGDDRLVASTASHRNIIRRRADFAANLQVSRKRGFPRVKSDDRADCGSADFSEVKV